MLFENRVKLKRGHTGGGSPQSNMTSVFFFNFLDFLILSTRDYLKNYFISFGCTAQHVESKIEPAPPAQDAQHFNHWTPRKVSVTGVLIRRKFAHR